MIPASIAAVYDAAGVALAVAWPEVTHRLGAVWLANHQDANPRVVWVPPPPGEERFEATDFPGGREVRILRMRVVRLVLHCSAATFAEAEQLGHDLASVLSSLLGASFALIFGGFASENEAELAQSEHVYLLALELRLPITDQLRGQTTTLADVEALPLTSEMQLQDGAPEIDVEPDPLPPGHPPMADSQSSPPDAPPSAAPEGTPAPRTVEAWAAAKATPRCFFNAAFLVERWCAGLEVPEADFDAAIARVAGEVIR